MSTAAVYSAVRTYLEANWTTTPLRWENETFTIPVDADGVPQPWVDVEITGTEYDQASLGAGTVASNLWREDGMLWLHVMVPSGSGSGVARTHAANLAALFRGLDLDPDIVFRTMSIGLGSPGDDDGNWWRLSLSIEWQSDT